MKPQWIRVAPETPDAGYQPGDDMRHRPAPGGRMRDSLFWQMTMPDEKLGFQAYLYMSDAGTAGFNVVIWGEDGSPQVLDLVSGDIPDNANLDRFEFLGLKLSQPELRRTAHVSYASDKLRLEYRFEALHEAFSYRQNPDGLPAWFAQNRFEQTGWVTGFIEFGGRRISWDRIGHRDHSWGARDWGMPHHWKWLIGYTPDGSRIINAWYWIARGETGCGGYIVRDGELLPIASIRHKAEYDDDMSQRRIRATLVDVRGGECEVFMERFGVVKLPTGGSLPTMIMEAACHAEIDGRAGAGQFETHWQRSYLDHLIRKNQGK